MADIAEKFGLAGRLTVRANLPPALNYTTGDYYGPAILDGVASSVIVVANKIYFVPFLCRVAQSFDRIAIYNTAAVTDHVRLAIYEDNGGGRPTALIVDGGELTLGGAAGDNAATISASLTAGLYWLAIVGDASIAVAGFTGTNWAAHADFSWGGMTYAANIIGCTTDHTYGALPDPVGTYDGLNGAGLPFIRLRAS